MREREIWQDEPRLFIHFFDGSDPALSPSLLFFDRFAQTQQEQCNEKRKDARIYVEAIGPCATNLKGVAGRTPLLKRSVNIKPSINHANHISIISILQRPRKHVLHAT